MGRVTKACIAFALLLIGVAEAAETHNTIPVRFRGTWASSAAHCVAPGAESRLTIRESTIDFYESRGRVLAIATDGDAHLALLVESSGEGMTWLGAREFELSGNHQTLTDVTGRRRGLARHRCPTAATAG